MIEKQHLRAVFLYMCEAEHCEASRPNREPGSWNFVSSDEQNIPDHKVRGAAMSRKLARPQAGVAKIASDGEGLFVTTKCGPESR